MGLSPEETVIAPSVFYGFPGGPDRVRRRLAVAVGPYGSVSEILGDGRGEDSDGHGSFIDGRRKDSDGSGNFIDGRGRGSDGRGMVLCIRDG